ncbi:MAG: carboxypeptidase-like regulatory domain-containing protein [Gemmatimonadaceae bacterium]
MRRLSFLAGALLCGAALQASAQGGAVTGVVREDSTNRPVAGAEVVIEKLRRQTTTDGEGKYLLGDLPAGTQVMLVRRIGYQPASAIAVVNRGETRTKDVTLTRTAAQLDTVKVVDRTKSLGIGLAGYEDRRRLGFGHFIDSTFLSNNEHRLLGDVMREISGVSLRNPPFCGQPYGTTVSERRMVRRINCVSARHYLVMTTAADCAIQIMVDGNVFVPGRRIDTDEPPRDPSNDWTTTYDISNFAISDLIAAEVYRRSADVPMEYRGYGTDCGLVLLWTRRGRR